MCLHTSSENFTAIKETESYRCYKNFYRDATDEKDPSYTVADLKMQSVLTTTEIHLLNIIEVSLQMLYIYCIWYRKYI